MLLYHGFGGLGGVNVSGFGGLGGAAVLQTYIIQMKCMGIRLSYSLHSINLPGK